jgi:NhaP-type Na+/H+ or K+/H+ antiporter
VALLCHVLVGLDWTESALLGALLSPTDPVLSSGVVTDPRIPRAIRHSLNLESGLNDGLALPAVLALLAALSTSSGSFVWWRFVLQDLGLGLLYGLACGWLASLLMPWPRAAAGKGVTSGTGTDIRAASGTGAPAAAGRRGRDRSLEHSIPAHQKSLFALGVAFATYGLTVLSPEGNGFIAVFVAAIVLGIRRPDLREHFERRADELVEIVKLGIFFVFGSLLTVHAFTREGWAAIALVAVVFVIARPLAVWLSLLGTRTDTATRLFMGWFGPKGIASMTFALIVLDRPVSAGSRIFDLTALVVFCSILLHGISDTPGAEWIARHAERVARRKRAPTRVADVSRESRR